MENYLDKIAELKNDIFYRKNILQRFINNNIQAEYENSLDLLELEVEYLKESESGRLTKRFGTIVAVKLNEEILTIRDSISNKSYIVDKKFIKINGNTQRKTNNN